MNGKLYLKTMGDAMGLVMDNSVENETPPPPKKLPIKSILGGLLEEARGGGHDSLLTEKKDEERRVKEDYERRHARSANAQPVLPSGLPSFHALQHLNNALQDGTAFRGDSYRPNYTRHAEETYHEQNTYRPENPYLATRSSHGAGAYHPQPPSRSSNRYRNSCQVGLCDHVDFRIQWDPSDPDNQKGSWSVGLEYYWNFGASEEAAKEDHKTCEPANRLARGKVLAERIIQKFTDMEDGKLSERDRRNGKEPRRPPPLNRVNREVQAMFSQMSRGKTNKIVEKKEALRAKMDAAEQRKEQVEKMQQQTQQDRQRGKLAKGLDVDDLEDDELAAKTKKSKKSIKPDQPQSLLQKQMTRERGTMAPPEDRFRPITTSHVIPRTRPKVREMTGEERALLAGIQQAEDEEKDQYAQAEAGAETNLQYESPRKSAQSEDDEELRNEIAAREKLNIAHDATPTMKASAAKKHVASRQNKEVEEGWDAFETARAELERDQSGKEQETVTVDTQAEPSRTNESTVIEQPHVVTTSKILKEVKTTSKGKHTIESDADEQHAPSPAPKPTNKSTAKTVTKKRKGSVSEDEADEGQPTKKKGRKEHKSATIIEDSDEEADYTLPQVGSELSQATIREGWQVEGTALVEEVVHQQEELVDQREAAIEQGEVVVVSETIEIAETVKYQTSVEDKPETQSDISKDALENTERPSTPVPESSQDHDPSPDQRVTDSLTTPPTSPNPSASKKRKNTFSDASDDEEVSPMSSPSTRPTKKAKTVTFSPEIKSPPAQSRKMSIPYIVEGEGDKDTHIGAASMSSNNLNIRLTDEKPDDGVESSDDGLDDLFDD